MKKILQTPSTVTLLSYTVATILIGLDILLSHDGLTANDGFSFYGGFARTVLPYSVALLIVAFGMFQVNTLIRHEKRFHRLADVYVFMMLCILGLVATPHTVLNAIHTFFGSLLFAVQLLLMMYLAWKTQKPLIILSVLAMFACGVLALLYLYPDQGFELEAQAGFQISFALGTAYYWKLQKH